MAIVRVTGGNGLERRVGIKAAKKAAKKGAKKGAKHAIEKHAAKKWAIEKHAGKKAAKEAALKAAKKAPAKVYSLKNDSHQPKQSQLVRAFHHLQRATSVISLLEQDSGGDLRGLLQQGVDLYRRAFEKGADKELAGQALGVLSAAEHMGMAGLYSARVEFRIEVPQPSDSRIEDELRKLRGRLETLGRPKHPEAEMLLGAAWELLRRADAAGDDPHLEWELAMAADGLCTALENGF